MRAKKISVSTHKGGAAKTVTTMASGAALARSGKRVLIVDLDPQGHSTLGLGVELAADDCSLRDLFTDPPRPAKELVRKTGVEGLSLIASDLRLARAAKSLYGMTKREEILTRRIEPLLEEYEFVLIDCPPSLGVLMDNAITAADFIIVPCQMEARAGDGLLDLLGEIAELKGQGFDAWRILKTRVDGRKSDTNRAVMQALEPWLGKLFKTEIPISEPLNKAQMVGTDIFSFDPKCTGAIAYEAFAAELVTL